MHLLILVALLAPSKPAQGATPALLGSEFWFTAPRSVNIPPDELWLEIHVEAPTTVTAEGLLRTTASAVPGTPLLLALREDQTAPAFNTSGAWGIRIALTDGYGQVFLRKRGPNLSSESRTAIHPASGLGTDYILDFASEGEAGQYGTVTATADGTLVSMRGLCGSGAPVDVSLDRGGAYQFYCPPGQYTHGAEILASAPVAVLAIDRCARLPVASCCCDSLAVMPVARPLLGTSYHAPALPRGAGAGSDTDLLGIVAVEDGTTVEIDDGQIRSVSLDRGQGAVLEHGAGAVLRSDARFAAFLYEKSADERGQLGDPEVIQLVATHQFDDTAWFQTEERWVTETLITLVSGGSGACGVELDGVPLSLTWEGFPDGLASHATVAVSGWGEHELRASSRLALYSHAHRGGGSLGTEIARRFVAEDGCDVTLEPCSGPTLAVCPGFAVALDPVARSRACAGDLGYRWTIDGMPMPALDDLPTVNITFSAETLVEVTGSCPSVADCDDRYRWRLVPQHDQVPGDQGNALRVGRDGADVRLDFSTASAPEIGIFRDQAKESTGATRWLLLAGIKAATDVGAVVVPEPLFYAVRGVSACSKTAGP